MASASAAALRTGSRAGWGKLVLGSETQVDAALVRHFAGDTRVALSLDFRGPSFQGPPALLDDTDCWPQTVIAMTLARVGSGAGPDLDRLCSIRDAARGTGRSMPRGACAIPPTSSP